MATRLRIGTRRSALALAQAREIAERIERLAFDTGPVETELVAMSTAGDRGSAAPPSAAGVKGMFVDDIVAALRRGDIDLAVHSAKDLPSADPDDVVVAAVPERADPFDVLVTREPALGPGAVVGTSSLRRRAQLLRSRPELVLTELRGNVDTRLAKLERGEVDGLVLAAAGLARLGISPAYATPMPLDEMVPAPGQGALAVQARADDDETLGLVRRLEHERSRRAFEAERRLVARLGGGCALPLGAYAEGRREGVRMLAVVIRPDGSEVLWSQVEAETPDEAACEAAHTLMQQGAREILRAAEVPPDATSR